MDIYDNNEDEFTHFQDQVKRRKQHKDSRYKDNSKRRLLNNIKKKFDTTIIGSLAAFEEYFGDLWGHGLPYEELDEDQIYWKEAWERARSQVLDNGNANLRAAQNEIAEYTLSWNRYVTKFQFEEDEEE